MYPHIRSITIVARPIGVTAPTAFATALRALPANFPTKFLDILAANFFIPSDITLFVIPFIAIGPSPFCNHLIIWEPTLVLSNKENAFWKILVKSPASVAASFPALSKTEFAVAPIFLENPKAFPVPFITPPAAALAAFVIPLPNPLADTLPRAVANLLAPFPLANPFHMPLPADFIVCHARLSWLLKTSYESWIMFPYSSYTNLLSLFDPNIVLGLLSEVLVNKSPTFILYAVLTLSAIELP